MESFIRYDDTELGRHLTSFNGKNFYQSGEDSGRIAELIAK